jgi:hypothetical protein
MPLAALVDDDLQISHLIEPDAWAQLKADAKAGRRSIKMRCGWPGIAKTSSLRTRYFAHKPGGDGCSAGETAQHLLAKAAIVDGIMAAGWVPEPEARGDGWIADVLATRGGIRVVFEVQWSSQDPAEYHERQRRYRDSGVRQAVWFARRAAELPSADPELPVFPLEVTADGDATVLVDGRPVPLSMAVEQLLLGTIRHRVFSDGARSAIARLGVVRLQCRVCDTRFAAWLVHELRTVGRCGCIDEADEFGLPSYRARRYEALPELAAAAAQIADRYRLRLGVLQPARSTYASTSYLAFHCPGCRIVFGEGHLWRAFDRLRWLDAVEVPLPAVPLHAPHWCRDGGDGLCGDWPDELRAALVQPSLTRERRYFVLKRGGELRVSERIVNDHRKQELSRLLDWPAL